MGRGVYCVVSQVKLKYVYIISNIFVNFKDFGTKT